MWKRSESCPKSIPPFFLSHERKVFNFSDFNFPLHIQPVGIKIPFLSLQCTWEWPYDEALPNRIEVKGPLQLPGSVLNRRGCSGQHPLYQIGSAERQPSTTYRRVRQYSYGAAKSLLGSGNAFFANCKSPGQICKCILHRGVSLNCYSF